MIARWMSGLQAVVLPLLFLGKMLFGGVCVFSQEYRLGTPEPAWIVIREPNISDTPAAADIANGLYFLLDENQDNLLPGRIARYFHQAYLIANRSGTEHGGELTIDFEPTYHSLSVHRLRIIRDGRVIDLTGKVRPSLLQRESNLEYRIYDGAKTLSLILPDVREHDIVEYSYTISGANPVFGGKLSTFRSFQQTTGVKRSYYRVLSPSAPPLEFRFFAGEYKPTVSSRHNTVEYVWDVSDMPALVLEDSLPAWHMVTPFVQISQYGSWRNVVEWALPLYEGALTRAKNIPALARQLTAAASTPDARLAALIEFVQGKIRYLGIEMGPSSHQPTPPDDVLEQRFGDCKDKSLLLTALCRAQGFKAWPVLVNTWLNRHVDNYLPAPHAFNHVIVLIRHDKREYWIDPTMSHQGTALEAITQANFGAGLIIRPGTAELSVMPDPSDDEPDIDITETYDLSRGNDVPAPFEISATTSGAAADRQRRYFEENNRHKIEKDSLAFYADAFPGIVSSGEISVTDVRSRNALTVTERYSITTPWVRDEDEGKYTFSLFPLDLASSIRKPNIITRTAPLAQSHPTHLRMVKEIDLPHRTWNLTNESGEISNEYFVFTYSATYRSWHYTYRFEFRSLDDHVPAAAVAGYAADLEKVKTNVDTFLMAADLAPDDPNTVEETNRSSSDDPLWTRLLFIIFPAAAIVLFVIARAVGARRHRAATSSPALVCTRCGVHSTPETIRFYQRCHNCGTSSYFCSVCFIEHQKAHQASGTDIGADHRS